MSLFIPVTVADTHQQAPRIHMQTGNHPGIHVYHNSLAFSTTTISPSLVIVNPGPDYWSLPVLLVRATAGAASVSPVHAVHS